jgi:hypothetical protein
MTHSITAWTSDMEHNVVKLSVLNRNVVLLYTVLTPNECARDSGVCKWHQIACNVRRVCAV